MSAAGAWYRRRVGLRGTALWATGAGWIAYGIGIITDPRYGVQRGVQVLTSICPLPWWGLLWILCGLTAAVTSVRRPGRDVVGFAGAALPPMTWAGAYVLAWATGNYPQAWTSVPAWCAPLTLLGVVATMSARYTAALRRIRALEMERADGPQ